MSKQVFQVGDILTSSAFGRPFGGVFVTGPGVKSFEKFLRKKRKNVRVGLVVTEAGHSVYLYPCLFIGKRRFVPVTCRVQYKVKPDGTVERSLYKGWAGSFFRLLEAWEGRKFRIIIRDNEGKFHTLTSAEFRNHYLNAQFKHPYWKNHVEKFWEEHHKYFNSVINLPYPGKQIKLRLVKTA